MANDTKRAISLAEANQNFSKATEIADEQGSVVILENNQPKYMLINLDDNPVIDLSDSEKVDIVARRVLEKYRKAFEELAK